MVTIRPTLNETSTSVIIGGTSIPWDAENSQPLDYLCEAGRIYQTALNAAGMTEPDPYVSISHPKAESVSPRQARLALLAAGILDQVEKAIADSDRATQIAWDFTTEISRDDPGVASIGSALKLTPDQIDVLFQYASTQ
jgi:hypothetical protein